MLFLKWAGIFFLIALIAAVFGFSGIAAGAADIAMVLFYIFLGICALLVIVGVIAIQKLT